MRAAKVLLLFGVYAGVSLGILMGLPCAQAQDSSEVQVASTIDAEVDTLLKTDRAWAKAASGNNIDEICGYWTDDAVLYNLFGTKLRVEGIEKIRALITKSRSEPGRSLSWIPVEGFVSESGDVGCTKGTFEVVGPGKDGKLATRTGTYFNIWKKASDGTWKCAIETHSE